MLRICAALLVSTLTSIVHGAGYPERPVRLIIPYPPGGNADLMARIVAQKLTEAFGQTFVGDNRGGAGGIIGEELGARAAPDGYTLVSVSTGHVLNAAMKMKLGYDPLKDLTAVSQVASVSCVLVVHNSVGVKSVPELVAVAKAQPGKLNSVFSQGTTAHVAIELFKAMTGTEFVNVNYRSGAVAHPDLEAGRVQMAFPIVTSAMTLLKGGRIRALALTSAKRSQALPDVPAMPEFLPGYEAIGWQGVVAPTGTPRAVLDTLSREIAKAMQSADVRKHLTALGADAVGGTAEEFERFRRAEYAKFSKLMKASAGR